MPETRIHISELDFGLFSGWIKQGGAVPLAITRTEELNHTVFKWNPIDGGVHTIYKRKEGRLGFSSFTAERIVREFLARELPEEPAVSKVSPIRPGVNLFSDTMVEGFANKLAKLRAEGVNPTGVVVVFFEDDGTTGIHWNTVHSVLPTKAVLGITLAAVTNLIAEE